MLEKTQKVAWAAFLVTLPVSSFPFFPPALGGEALVRPLSLYPLLVLIPIAVLPRLIKRPLPRTILPLLPFVLVALASSLLSLLRGIEPALGVSATARTLRGVITLGIGSAIYLTVALLPDTIRDLRFTLRWIYTGGAIALFWGSLQAVYVLDFNQGWFDFLSGAQRFISTRRLLTNRISGLTYEPNWFGEQIILLLLPWLLASVLWNYTVFHWRWRRLTIEWLLLVWAVILLPFTYSRAGVFNLMVLTVASIILFRPRFRQKNAGKPLPPTKRRLSFILSQYLIEFTLAIALVAVPIYLVGTQNLFFARIWEYWQQEETSFSGYLSYLGFDARLVYSQAAFQTYKAHPFLGVGLGNYAFYFEEMLPNRPIAEVPEVLRVITPEAGRDRLITSKNLYLRLMAETGIIGAITFLTFAIANLGCALYLWLSSSKEHKFWGVASLISMIAFTLSAFTFDSFVIPNMWVVFGLITAAAQVFSHSPNTFRPQITQG